MQDLPHRYSAAASARAAEPVELSSSGLPDLQSDSPAEFGGPGDRWSPETLLVASVADCFVLTFRAIARASRFEWSSLSCDVEGELDRRDKTTQFVGFKVRARLEVPGSADEARARRLLEKAEENCLITNSLKAEASLEVEVRASA